MTSSAFPAPLPEAAFAVAPTAAADVVARLEQRFRLNRHAPVALQHEYLDTPDWRLFRAELTLARQVEGRANLLVLSSFAAEAIPGGPLERSPSRGAPEFPWELPAGPLRERVRRAAAVRRLLPQVATRVEVTALEVLDGREKIVVRVHMTEGTARDADGDRPLPTVMRVEPLRGYEEERDAVVAFLAADPALSPSSDSPLAAAMRAVGREPRSEAPAWKVDLDPEAPAGVELRRVLARLHEVMSANERGVREDVDTEYLHDFRVAVRRTRSILSHCRSVLAPDELEHFREEFAWLGKVTSEVRDLDVFLLAAHGRAGDLAGSDPSDLVPLQQHLARRRRAAWKRMRAALDSARYHYASESWAAFLEAPSPADPEGGGRPVVEFAAERITKQHRRVLKRGAGLDADTPAADVHALRIECKKLRYLLDALGGLFAVQPVARATKRLKQLQGALGDYNDAEVQAEMLRGMAHELKTPPPEKLINIGRAIERLAGRAEALRPKLEQRVEVFAREVDRDQVRELVRSVRS
jgi:CHAD domain-containing protein